MKVTGNVSPPGAYSIEKQPDRPGYVCVRFYENAQEITPHDEADAGEWQLWEYDEYKVITRDQPKLSQEIEENYSQWLETAKSLEPDAGAAAPAELLEELEDLRQANNILMGVQS